MECKILEKEITGRIESMILNTAYLIKAEMVEEFIKSAERKNKELNSQGFSLEYYGRLWGFREETYYILVVKEKTGCQMKR